MNGHKVGTLPEDGALYKIRFALRKEHGGDLLSTPPVTACTSAGTAKTPRLAPIRETLAAAIADLGRVRRDFSCRIRSAAPVRWSSRLRRRR